MNETEQLARQFFEAVDALDNARASQLLSDDVDFRFGSASPTVGRQAFDQFAASLAPHITTLSHRLIQTWTVQPPPSTVMCETEVTYTRHDGSTLTLPCMTKLQAREGRISVLRIFMDINPLLASQ